MAFVGFFGVAIANQNLKSVCCFFQFLPFKVNLLGQLKGALDTPGL
jgi:hypothetical protein